MSKGGAQPGAGRPRKADQHAGVIKRAEKRIADHLPELIDRMFELADGVMVEDFNIVTMKTSVYKEKPDRAALVYLIDRILGKPTERQELSGPDGTAIPITMIEAIKPDAT